MTALDIPFWARRASADVCWLYQQDKVFAVAVVLANGRHSRRGLVELAANRRAKYDAELLKAEGGAKSEDLK